MSCPSNEVPDIQHYTSQVYYRDYCFACEDDKIIDHKLVVAISEELAALS